jgi:DNA mismatch repair protein MSH6
VQCRTLFATHYHLLTDEFAGHPAVRAQQMACHVQPGSPDVTFLYKLIPGVCAKSYGMNVARLAGMPASIIAVAIQRAEEFERSRGLAGRARHVAHARLFCRLMRLLAAATVRAIGRVS